MTDEEEHDNDEEDDGLAGLLRLLRRRRRRRPRPIRHAPPPPEIDFRLRRHLLSRCTLFLPSSFLGPGFLNVYHNTG